MNTLPYNDQNGSPYVAGRRHGLSLIEFLLALSITGLVGAAICAMLGAVLTGADTKTDARTVLVRANGAQMRLTGYIAPSLRILEIDATNLVLWLADSRRSDSVHATEIRWLLYDSIAGTIDVYYVDFPDNWTHTACEVADAEYSEGTDWYGVLTKYTNEGLITSLPLVDGLNGVTLATDNPNPKLGAIVEYILTFETATDNIPVLVSSPITQRSDGS